MIEIKRINEPPDAVDGVRFLAERLWPRGVRRELARFDHWLKYVAPVGELCRWSGHTPRTLTALRLAIWRFANSRSYIASGNPIWQERTRCQGRDGRDGRSLLDVTVAWTAGPNPALESKPRVSKPVGLVLQSRAPKPGNEFVERFDIPPTVHVRFAKAQCSLRQEPPEVWVQLPDGR